MATAGHNNLSLNDVGVHAGLGVVVQGDQGPVCDNTTNVLAAQDVGVLTDDQVLCQEQGERGEGRGAQTR